MGEDIREFLAEDWSAFQQLFVSLLHSSMPLLNKINGYLFERSGKQLRPMLALLTAKACNAGFCNDKAIRCAAASEMLHTATLLHDDVADDSDLRRGAPSVKALYTPTTSVLVGDFWLSRAIETIVRECDQRIILCFSKCLEDLAEGEMLQLEKAETLDTTEEDYLQIIYRKTASLFETAIISSAMAVDAKDEDIAAFRKYAYHLGLAFQMMDDIFDYSPSVKTGKPAGRDVMEKKITLPLLGAFHNAPDAESEKIRSAIRLIGQKENAGESVHSIMQFVTKYKGLEYAHARLEEEVENCINSLVDIAQSHAKTYLASIAGYMALRAQ